MDIRTSVHGHDGIPESEGGTGTKRNGLSETTSKHGSTRGRGDEYITGSEFTAVLGVDCARRLKLNYILVYIYIKQGSQAN